MATPTQSQLGLTIAAFTNELLEIQAQVQNFAKMPIKEVSKVRLSSLSSLLRELSKQLPRFPPPQTNEERKTAFEMHEIFKALVLEVNRLLKEIIEARRALVQSTETDVSGVQRVLKKPQLLNGYLKKQGEKGVIKNWKRRYFRQAGKYLQYFESQDTADGSLGNFSLEEVTQVIKKNNFCFDLVLANRTYHLQAKDDLEWNLWVIKTEEWIEYYKQQAIERLKSASANSPEERKKYEESIKMLTAQMDNYEAESEILEKQINDLVIVKKKLISDTNENKEKTKQILLTEIAAYDTEIQELYSQLKVKEEQLILEEKRSDQIISTVSKEASKLVLLEVEHTDLSQEVEKLKKDLISHSESISNLEKSISEEMDKQKRTSNLNSKEFRELSYQLNEKRSANQKLQSQNSALNDEINLLAKQHQTLITEKKDMIKSRELTISRYDEEYKEILEIVSKSNGATLDEAIEFESLKEKYFNSLLLQMKLQNQMGLNKNQIDINFSSLYPQYEFVDFKLWPQKLQKQVFSPQQSGTPKKRQPIPPPPLKKS